METKIIIIVLLLINIVTSETALCFNNKIAVYECCQDYKNNSGNCEECIGSWGKNCSNNCTYGYYGHGCRTRCNCIFQEICDPMEGCVEDSAKCKNNKIGEKCQNYTDGFANVKASSDSFVNQTVASLLAVSGLLILLLLGTVFYCNRNLKKQSVPFQRCKEHVVNTSEIQDGQEYFIYNDIRESHMVDNGCVLSGVYNLPPQFCDLTSSIEKDRVMNNQTRFKTVGLEEYGRWYRGSDNYNHINFTTAKQLSSFSDVMTSDYMYDITTSHETQVNDDDSGNIQLKKETIKIRHGSVIHQNRKSTSMVNRPYSSVKYNRNMRMNEEH